MGLMEDIATGKIKYDTQVYNILKQIAEHLEEWLKNE